MFTRSQLWLGRSHIYVDEELSEIQKDRIAMFYVTAVGVNSIKERWVVTNNREKQYAFVLNVAWSEDSSSVVWRIYTDFFEFQCQLLDYYPEEASSVRGFVTIIPYLPGTKENEDELDNEQDSYLNPTFQASVSIKGSKTQGMNRTDENF